MKMTRLTRIGIAALAVAFLVWGGVALLSPPPTKIAAEKDDRRCPECGHELPLVIQENGGECPYCQAQGKSVKVGKSLGGGSSITHGPAIPIALVSALVVLLGIHGYFMIRRRAAAAKVEEDIYYVNCRKCARKLRYRESQVGRLAKCPICRTLIRFPQLPEESQRRGLGRLLGKLVGR
jgi:Zn finger protein HypA/HybF involved in hydrogenase expression